MSHAKTVPGKTQTTRSRINIPLKSAPYASNVERLYPWMAARIMGSWSPIRTNTKPFKMKFNASQTDHAWIRTEGEKKRELPRDRNNPQETTASTPEA